MALDKLCSMHIEQYSFPRYFSATDGWISTKLCGNQLYQEATRISSSYSGQTLQHMVMALDKLCIMHAEQYWFLCYFSATDGWISTKLCGNYQY
jgi:hypothetical protein